MSHKDAIINMMEGADSRYIKSPMQKIYHEILQVEEKREQTILEMNKIQQVVKRYFDKRTTSKDFQKDQLVLLWNKEKEKPSSHTKFESL
jgi:hypothetical protein